MGLLDSAIGSVTGSGQGSSSPTSPMVKALMLLLAAKAASSYMSGSSSHQSAAPQPSAPGPQSGTIQSGILAGLPSLESLMDRFRRGGQEDKFQSWVSHGENKSIQPQELHQALGP